VTGKKEIGMGNVGIMEKRHSETGQDDVGPIENRCSRKGVNDVRPIENRYSEKVKAQPTVTFKGDFLGKLIDAAALIAVLELAIKNHTGFNFDNPSILGITILVEQVKELLDINANLLG
jgi:hypothetical protein